MSKSYRKYIQQVKNGWQTLKMQESIRCRQEGDSDLAQKLAGCSALKGDEDLGDICALALSPKGIEFITEYHFPKLELFRKFIPFKPERFGIYIDKDIIIKDNCPRDIFLIGDTNAEIELHDRKLYHINLAHGARAVITVSGYSVVRICKDGTSSVVVHKADSAKILE